MLNRLKQRKRTGIKAFLLLVVTVAFLQGCGMGKERYELSEYVNDSIKTFQRKTGEKLIKDSNGVYRLDDELQLIEEKGEITSIIILAESKKFSFDGVKIGDQRTEAEEVLVKKFGTESAKTINTDRNTTIYTYKKDTSELYVSYDLDTNGIVEIAYYFVPAEVAKVETQMNASNGGELILMVGDVRVYYNEAMVYLKSVQGNYEAEFGSNIWSADIFGDGVAFGDKIKDEIINQITELKIISEKAKEMDISLAEDEWAQARAFAREHFERLSDQDVDKYIVTKQLLEQVYADNMLATKMFETLTINVDNQVSDKEAKQITVQHILIRSGDVDSSGKVVPYDDAVKNKAYEKVESLLEKAKETNDFSSLAETNSQAEDMEYTFGHGEGPKEYGNAFEEAAFKLKTGQVSNIITTDYGWHIIYCVSDFNLEATNQVKENIIEARRSKMFANLYKAWSSEYDVVVNTAAWSTVSFED